MLPIIHGVMDKKMAAPIDLSGTSTSHDTINDVPLDTKLIEFQTMKAAIDPAKVSPIFLVHHMLSITFIINFACLFNFFFI